jgi:hypothetical protein
LFCGLPGLLAFHDRIHPRDLDSRADDPDASGLEYGIEPE